MEKPEAKLLSVQEERGLYRARISIVYGGRTIEVDIKNLVKRPVSLATRIEGDYILVDMKDPTGNGIATCCIHRGYLEKGVTGECHSLIIPPESKC
ncbi:MAG: hypothetical protein GSR86_07565 [Desulfurococcales archaeon]|nr:hypothetical protein [Desulfurococcales archaeon]